MRGHAGTGHNQCVQRTTEVHGQSALGAPERARTRSPMEEGDGRMRGGSRKLGTLAEREGEAAAATASARWVGYEFGEACISLTEAWHTRLGSLQRENSKEGGPGGETSK